MVGSFSGSESYTDDADRRVNGRHPVRQQATGLPVPSTSAYWLRLTLAPGQESHTLSLPTRRLQTVMVAYLLSESNTPCAKLSAWIGRPVR